MTTERQCWDEYFMDIAEKVATRSTCLRRQVGAVAINANHRIIGSGYNGAPSGLDHCTKDTCIRTIRNIPSGTQLDICKAIHAEANIVLQLGDSLKNGSLYCTNQPCTSCLKLLMGAGINKIIWKNPYPDEYAAELMTEYGVPFFKNGYLQLWKDLTLSYGRVGELRSAFKKGDLDEVKSISGYFCVE